MREDAVAFGTSALLSGIITEPAERESSSERPAVLLLNSGIVHRVGPNRLYVALARLLARMGYVVLRFDFSGIGDSGRRTDSFPFAEAAISDTRQAMDFLHVTRRANRFILAGICSGALIALRTAGIDPRVTGVVSINLAGHRSRNGRYYGRTLVRHYGRIAFSKSFGLRACRNALLGSIDLRTLRGATRSLAAGLLAPKDAEPQESMPFQDLIRHLVASEMPLALIHSEGDEGLDYMKLALGDDLRTWTTSGTVQFVVIPGANHTFTLLENQQDLLDAVSGFIQHYELRPRNATVAARA